MKILSRIYEMQKKLDNTVDETHGITGEDVTTKKILALIVEIGEFANEISSFKYWKKNINVQKDLVLEEYADGLHFFASFYVGLDVKEDVKPILASNDLNEMFLELYSATTDLKNGISLEKLNKAFGTYIGIAKLMKFDEEEVLEYYFKKNKINFERMKNNY